MKLKNMLNKESTDKEILDFPLANSTIRGIGSITFLGFIANKLNGVQTYKAATQELIALVSSPPIGKLPEGEKVRIVRKLFELDITL